MFFFSFSANVYRIYGAVNFAEAIKLKEDLILGQISPGKRKTMISNQ